MWLGVQIYHSRWGKVVYTIISLCPIDYTAYYMLPVTKCSLNFYKMFNQFGLKFKKSILFNDITNLRHIRTSWCPYSCRLATKRQSRHALLLLVADKLRWVDLIYYNVCVGTCVCACVCIVIVCWLFKNVQHIFDKTVETRQTFSTLCIVI